MANRVLFGVKGGRTVFQVSQPGVNVLAASKNSQYLFNTDGPSILPVLGEAQASVAANAGTNVNIERVGTITSFAFTYRSNRADGRFLNNDIEDDLAANFYGGAAGRWLSQPLYVEYFDVGTGAWAFAIAVSYVGIVTLAGRQHWRFRFQNEFNHGCTVRLLVFGTP